MSQAESRVPNKQVAFKNASEADRRLVQRLYKDRTNPQWTAEKDGVPINVQALADVFRRNIRDVSDIANIFKVMPDLNLPRDILVSAVCSPGDLATTTLIFEGLPQGGDQALVSMLCDRLQEHFLKEKETHNEVHEWVDEALVLHGAHPILIMPEASIDRMVNGTEDASMESVANFSGEWLNGWFKPKGILGISVPTSGNKVDHVSFESARNRISFQDMAEYHTIKAQVNAKDKLVPLPIRVTDNLAMLRTPAVQEIKRSRTMTAAYGELSMETRRRERLERKAQEESQQPDDDKSADKSTDKGRVRRAKSIPTDGEIYSRFFKAPQKTHRTRMKVMPTLKQSGGKTIGHPVEYHLPTQAVIPVCVPGDRKNHLGYFVILDGNGYPVAAVRSLDYYDDVRRGTLGGGEQVGSGSQIAGELLNMAAGAIGGGVANASDAAIDRMADLCGNIVDRDLMARLKTGVMGGDFELARTDSINKLLLARTCKNELTTLLYVPADMMIYMAYDYNEYGVGKSILEDAKGLCAMRANLMVANTLGAIANAIPGKDINIELDPRDKNPTQTVAFMVNEAMALAFNQLPMSINSPQGIAEALQMTSYAVNVTGNPRYPEIKTTITPRESQQVAIDSDTLQQARDDVTRVFSVTPEMVDNMNQPEFATTAVNNSLLLLKRVMLIQRLTNPMLTDYVRIYSENSGILTDDMLDIIEENSKYLPKEFKDEPELYLKNFLNTLSVKLPAPDVDNLEKHMELYSKYDEHLDKAIGAFLKDEYLDGYTTQIKREALPTIIASWKGQKLREFMRERGIFRELDIFGNAEDGSPLQELNEEMAAYNESLDKAFGAYSQRAAKDAIARSARNKELAHLDEEARTAAEAEPIASDASMVDAEPVDTTAEGGADRTQQDAAEDALDAADGSGDSFNNAPTEPAEASDTGEAGDGDQGADADNNAEATADTTAKQADAASTGDEDLLAGLDDETTGADKSGKKDDDTQDDDTFDLGVDLNPPKL